MNSNNFNVSPIDHFIQADIIHKLYGHDVLPFSDLKQDDIENSLFMYHMHKLIDRGVAEKTEQGFKLTLKGIRWVNYLGPSSLQPKLLPRLLINFIITDTSGTQILLSRRIGPAATVLHEYLLPGGLYPYGVDFSAAAIKVAGDMGLPPNLAPHYIAMVEKLSQFNDGYMQHTVSALFSAQYAGPDPKGTEHFALEWVPTKDVMQNVKGTYDSLLQQTVQKYASGQLQPFETLSFSEQAGI